MNLLISEFSELKRRFNNNRHSSRLIINHRELRFTKRGYTHLDIPNFVPIFVQTSDQGSSSTSSLPHCNTRYFGKIAHLSFFKAFWDETNSVKVVRSLSRWTLFFTRISSVANVLKSLKSSLPFLYTSRWISVDTLQFAIWSPSATLCDVYPHRFITFENRARTMCKKVWLCCVHLFGFYHCLPNTVPWESHDWRQQLQCNIIVLS